MSFLTPDQEHSLVSALLYARMYRASENTLMGVIYGALRESEVPPEVVRLFLPDEDTVAQGLSALPDEPLHCLECKTLFTPSMLTASSYVGTVQGVRIHCPSCNIELRSTKVDRIPTTLQRALRKGLQDEIDTLKKKLESTEESLALLEMDADFYE